MDQVINEWEDLKSEDSRPEDSRSEDPRSEEDEENEVAYPGNIKRERRREWRVKNAVLLNDGKQRETCIRNDAYADQGGDGLENGAMDAEQKDGKSGKEEKKGDMEQRW